MTENEFHDALLAADMRFEWAMKEVDKYRIENERLKEEVVQLNRSLRKIHVSDIPSDSYVKYYGED
jgi:hypothetical protein